MKDKSKNAVFFFILMFALVITACGGGARDTADTAVEAYLQALVAKDADRISTLSCAAWEEDALLELDSFTAVEVTLNDADCQEASRDGDTALVECQGTIVASYNGEDLEIGLDERTYQAVREGGEWRMCGYR